ncbi:MAG TPA: nicotinate (nicotinamide) nucleotide adenylyltransferase, partial [Bacteroidia bacterium]|nr:nicotinate (nicotinamide) nucleotide adenylyltransferase [Bacteroidia bacterium]
MKIGLFFGSFNPIHKGHIAIVKYMIAHTDLEQVWLIVSPHNPLKNKNILAGKQERLKNAKKAVKNYSEIKVSSIEFSLPQPSYTINTLKVLRKKYPKYEFVIIMGADNLYTFHKWKKYKDILENYKIYIYPRRTKIKKKLNTIFKHKHINFVKAPLLNIS